MTAQLYCTLDDFNKLIGPRIKNDVATMTKSKKNELNLICQECGEKSNELDAAHKSGRSRKDIIKIVLDDYESKDGEYIIPNLQKIIKRIKKEHLPIENNFRFLCKPCHKKYDDAEKKQTDNIEITNNFDTQNDNVERKQTDNIEITNNFDTQNDVGNQYQREFSRLLSVISNLKDCLKQLFLKFPNQTINSTELRKTYAKYYPNKTKKQTQIVTDYLWGLANENFLENTDRSFYKLKDKKLEE